MRSLNRQIVVLGGGIAGLMACALLLKKGFRNIILIESSPEPGGLLKSFDYPQWGSYDYGTHYLSNTYPDEINEIFMNALPENEWAFHRGVRAELSGLYFNGNLQLDTVFPDLRNLPSETYVKLLGEVLGHLNSKTDDNIKTSVATADDYLKGLYGNYLPKIIFEPVLKKIFGLPLNELTDFAAKLVPLQRVVLFNETVAKEILTCKILNSIHAFPKQLDLPESYAPAYVSMYPKQRGIQKVINGIVSNLISSGVEIRLNTAVAKLSIHNNLISKIYLNSGETLNPDILVNATSLVQFQKLLVPDQTIRFEHTPKHTVITNMAIKSHKDLNDRHYYYCYEDGMKTFRVTNYSAITGCKEELMHITVESLWDELPDEKSINDTIQKEQIKMGLVTDVDQFVFIKSETLKYGFPLLSVKNQTALDDIRTHIKSLDIKNLLNIGALSEKNVFFMKDTLKDVQFKINQHL